MVESLSVSLFSGNEKVCIKRGGEYHDFPSKICLIWPKTFLVYPPSVSLIRLPGKFHASKSYVDFLSNLFCLTVPNIFRGEPFCAVSQNYSGGGKVFV